MADEVFHPDLRLARFLPRASVSPRLLRPVRGLVRFSTAIPRGNAVMVPVAPGVSVRVFRPTSTSRRLPALLWMHGGGYVFGRAKLDDKGSRALADELGIVVVSLDYRLAPEHPFPAPLEDCYTGLRWLARQPDVDTDRIAIGGASAGGGLAAALALLAKERDEMKPVFQMLCYPMLDDRTAARTDVDGRRLRMWSQNNNRFGWQSYLGPSRAPDVPPLAAPARYDDLAGLPPAWIGVGTNDLFHDEDVAYAHQLRKSGVDCELHITHGAYHGFDLVEAKAGVSRTFTRSRTAALAAALNIESRAPGGAGGS